MKVYLVFVNLSDFIKVILSIFAMLNNRKQVFKLSILKKQENINFLFTLLMHHVNGNYHLKQDTIYGLKRLPESQPCILLI